ncbi:hypothetical protein FCV82_02470 [Vibrio breoganii]|uniref:hypothetical protein n=1 Tax=Vibrio breoganii TaxID=553239 RepID=UPI000C850569|nr:hypothetical protein [Vibrio breoganii]PMN72721.1 hypothetical protein BCT28_16860 [Vibrio breoganii]PMO77934.1 hypothetical protein BCT00_18010 [Vibrio breoganii]TKF90453.1 hypothetical protein FCV82_02470 [Vibrio breoganii]
MDIQLPKRATAELKKRADKLMAKIESGTIQLRKTERHGYRTAALGRGERAVIIENVVHVFSKHSDYEKFINRAA